MESSDESAGSGARDDSRAPVSARIAHAHMCARGWRVFCLRAYSATPLACDESDFGCRARAKIADPVDRAFQNNEKVRVAVACFSFPCRLRRDCRRAVACIVRRRRQRYAVVPDEHRRRWPRNARTSCTSWPTISAIPTSMHSAARSTRRTSTRSSRRAASCRTITRAPSARSRVRCWCPAPTTISSAKARWACRPTNGAGCPATRAT